MTHGWVTGDWLRGAALACAAWGACLPTVAEANVDAQLVALSGTRSRPAVGRCGHVPYDFAIARSEVSNSDYAAFLNAVARLDDPFALYTPLMAAHFWGGLVRNGQPGAYRYAAKTGYEWLPVTFVSWWSAARYVNWLEFGQPAAGYSTVGTTEGRPGLGTYDTSQAGLPGGINVKRAPTARFALPTCDEWSKAAYYDPASAKFLTYPNGANRVRPTAAPQAGRDSANMMRPDGFANPFPHLVPVDRYGEAASAAGTVHQAGNVLEWLEDRWGDLRLALGGSLFMYPKTAAATYRDGERADHRLSTLGFRIVRLPGELAKVPIAPPGATNKLSAPPPEPVGPYVTIGAPGNEDDPLYDAGGVADVFEIQRSEISNADYSTFLNAVARRGDRFGLFRNDMATGVAGGLTRERRGNEFRYRPKPGWEQRPITYLTWFALARYANWQHYGRPDSGLQTQGSTEGTDRDGAYDTRHFPSAPGATFDPRLLPKARNAGARYFIPTSDEWYKAAYFDPALYGKRRYRDYPFRVDGPPTVDVPGRRANLQVGDRLGEGDPFFVAPVDAYADSPASSGTQQQAGNVWEWLEDWRSQGEGGCWRCDEWTRGLRGGSFNYTFRGAHAENVDPGAPDHAYFVYGGRLARRPSADGGR